MVKVFRCPDHNKVRGTCASWSESGVVKAPDENSKASFQTLCLDDTLYLQAADKGFSLTWKNRVSSQDGETFIVSQADYGECEIPDCCRNGVAAKREGNL